jgi:beta-lactam-binding protein with PASTA domain
LEKIEKKPIKIDPKVMIAGIIALLVIIGAVWYFVFAPKIPMPNFVGKTINDVGAWAKQNDIPTSNIIMNTEFSTEFDKDVIISQDKAEGKKIKDTTPLAFVASKGADPDEQVEFPDLMNMTYSEIKEWIDTNKLSKTKINTQYNTIVEKDLVINYDLKTGTESGFTRGSSLTINISKGPAPAGTVAVDNFVGKTYAELEQWANSKKIVLEKTEAYSDTVEVGKIISQGVKVGESLEEGGKLPVVVSRVKRLRFLT